MISATQPGLCTVIAKSFKSCLLSCIIWCSKGKGNVLRAAVPEQHDTHILDWTVPPRLSPPPSACPWVFDSHCFCNKIIWSHPARNACLTTTQQVSLFQTFSKLSPTVGLQLTIIFNIDYFADSFWLFGLEHVKINWEKCSPLLWYSTSNLVFECFDEGDVTLPVPKKGLKTEKIRSGVKLVS